MYIYKRTILLKETDATGVLFFSEQLNLALEALENYFSSCSFSLIEMIDSGDFLLPIVHAEADFFSPLRVGDEVSIALGCEKVGTSSFTLTTEFRSGREGAVGTTKIVHVAISKQSQKAIALPPLLLEMLNGL